MMVIKVESWRNCQYSTNASEANNTISRKSKNWMVLSLAGDKPTPRFNHAVVGAFLLQRFTYRLPIYH